MTEMAESGDAVFSQNLAILCILALNELFDGNSTSDGEALKNKEKKELVLATIQWVIDSIFNG